MSVGIKKRSELLSLKIPLTRCRESMNIKQSLQQIVTRVPLSLIWKNTTGKIEYRSSVSHMLYNANSYRYKVMVYNDERECISDNNIKHKCTLRIWSIRYSTKSIKQRSER